MCVHPLGRRFPRLAGWLCAAAWLLAACLAAPAVAHPVSLTRTNIYLTREQATVKIEVFLEDLFLFHQLKPNDQDFLEPGVIQQGIRLHEQFIQQRFEISDIEGERIEPEYVEVRDVELPAEGVPLAELMAHQLTFELQLLFDSPPEFLTFVQRFTDEESVLPSEMRLLVKQENAGAPYEQTLLPNIPYSLRISWENPPLSPEASEQERAEWEARKQEELLGITSYSSVYSFLYVEDYEVRHEILAPVMTLDEDLVIARDGDEMLDVAEQNAARRQIEAYFASGNPVEIDGQTMTPVVERCEFYGLDMTDFAVRTESRPVPLSSARVGVILSYKLPRRPQRIKMTWDRFNNSLWSVSAAVLAGDEVSRTTLARVGKDRQSLEWQRTADDSPPAAPTVVEAAPLPRATLSVPWLSLLLAAFAVGWLIAARRRGGRAALPAAALAVAALLAWPEVRAQAPRPWGEPPSLPADDARRLFAEVHGNLYLAFAAPDEQAIYDRLAVSVDGPLLQEIYLQVRRGLEMQEQGGATAKIRQVEIVEQAPLTLPTARDASLAVRCRWNVSGTIEHWGHIHERTNQYEARFHLEAVDAAWKVVGLELLDEQRVDTQTTLRRG